MDSSCQFPARALIWFLCSFFNCGVIILAQYYNARCMGVFKIHLWKRSVLAINLSQVVYQIISLDYADCFYTDQFYIFQYLLASNPRQFKIALLWYVPFSELPSNTDYPEHYIHITTINKSGCLNRKRFVELPTIFSKPLRSRSS